MNSNFFVCLFVFQTATLLTHPRRWEVLLYFVYHDRHTANPPKPFRTQTNGARNHGKVARKCLARIERHWRNGLWTRNQSCSKVSWYVCVESLFGFGVGSGLVFLELQSHCICYNPTVLGGSSTQSKAMRRQMFFFCFVFVYYNVSRVEFLLKTDSGYPKDMRDTLFTMANAENPLCYIAPGIFFFSVFFFGCCCLAASQLALQLH